MLLRRRSVLPLVLLGGVLPLVPFAGLSVLRGTSPLAGLSGVASPLLTSLAASAAVLAVSILFGTPLAWIMAKQRGREVILVEALWMLLLVTPPLVLGLLLAEAFGPYEPLGRLVGSLGLTGSNSGFALFLATLYEAAPYYVLGALGAFAQQDAGWAEAAALIGLSPLRRFLSVHVPLSSAGLAMAAAMTWARAMGAFGAVVIVAYHPYGLPLLTWVTLQTNGLFAALSIALLLLLVSVPLPLVLWGWSRRVQG